MDRSVPLSAQRICAAVAQEGSSYGSQPWVRAPAAAEPFTSAGTNTREDGTRRALRTAAASPAAAFRGGGSSGSRGCSGPPAEPRRVSPVSPVAFGGSGGAAGGRAVRRELPDGKLNPKILRRFPATLVAPCCPQPQRAPAQLSQHSSLLFSPR